MKKFLVLLAVVALLSTLGVTAAMAQGTGTSAAPGTWVSSINIQNTGTAAAQVVISFYNAAGTDVLDFAVTPDIAAGGSRSLYLPSDVTGLGNGQFSAVVSSSQLLQVVVNSSSTGPSTAGAYSGLQPDQIGATLYFPGLYRAYYGFESEVVLQNTDAAQADISIQFYSQATGAPAGSPITAAIAGNSSKVFALKDLAGVPSGNSNGLLSAKVTSSKSLAGVANHWTAAAHGEFSNYDAFVGGVTSAIFAPALYNNYYGFVSSLTVQNLGGTATDVRITYSNGTNHTQTVQPGQAFQWYQPSDPALPTGNTNGVFSAKLESFAVGTTTPGSGQAIVAIVNGEHKGAGSLASYNVPAATAKAINCPVVMKSFYGWFSAETVQNVGANPATFTITYAGGQTFTTPMIQVNGTYNFVEKGMTNTTLPEGSSVSAKITSAEPIVAVVQENSETRYAATAGDYLTAYTCVTQ